MVSLELDSAPLAETYDRVGERQFNHGKLLVKDLEISAGDRVLDVGCGTGRLGAHVAGITGPSGEVVGIDPLPFRVKLSNQKRAPGFSAIVGTAIGMDPQAPKSLKGAPSLRLKSGAPFDSDLTAADFILLLCLPRYSFEFKSVDLNPDPVVGE